MNGRFVKNRRVRRSGEPPGGITLPTVVIVGVRPKGGGGLWGTAGVSVGNGPNNNNSSWGDRNGGSGALVAEDPCQRNRNLDECRVIEIPPGQEPEPDEPEPEEPPEPCEGYVSMAPPELAPSDGKSNYRGGTFGKVRNGGKRMHRGLDLAMLVGTALYLPYDNGLVVGVVNNYRPYQYISSSV